MDDGFSTSCENLVLSVVVHLITKRLAKAGRPQGNQSLTVFCKITVCERRIPHKLLKQYGSEILNLVRPNLSLI